MASIWIVALSLPEKATATRLPLAAVHSRKAEITSSRTTMLEPHDVTKLPKGEAFALLEGGQLYKLRLPLPTPSGRSAGEAFEALAADMRRRYEAAGTLGASDAVLQDMTGDGRPDLMITSLITNRISLVRNITE